MNADRSLHTELLPARESSSRRLLVVLHGLGDSLEGYRWMPTELRLPWLNYLLVNAPDDYFGGYSWYDIYGDAGPGVARSRTLLTALLEDLPRRGFEPANTALFGFSQGCLMVLETGLRFPHRLAGLIGISGYLHDVATLLRELSPVAAGQRILMTHGTEDPLLPIAPVRKQVELLRARGLDVQWREFNKAHTIAGEEELSLIREFLRTCRWGQSLKPE
ncbi:MAG: serine esterase [Verrucomicrobia bacterium]|nr:serine esterase [Verrucomicrobiota bacterium]